MNFSCDVWSSILSFLSLSDHATMCCLNKDFQQIVFLPLVSHPEVLTTYSQEAAELLVTKSKYPRSIFLRGVIKLCDPWTDESLKAKNVFARGGFPELVVKWLITSSPSQIPLLITAMWKLSRSAEISAVFLSTAIFFWKCCQKQKA
jgi:hypothetical protein